MRVLQAFADQASVSGENLAGFWRDLQNKNYYLLGLHTQKVSSLELTYEYICCVCISCV